MVQREKRPELAGSPKKDFKRTFLLKWFLFAHRLEQLFGKARAQDGKREKTTASLKDRLFLGGSCLESQLKRDSLLVVKSNTLGLRFCSHYMAGGVTQVLQHSCSQRQACIRITWGLECDFVTSYHCCCWSKDYTWRGICIFPDLFSQLWNRNPNIYPAKFL